MENIRNFCIIAHIDHGKSTLADRFLELTHTVEKRDMKHGQHLDTMELEQERGITIKLQPVRMEWKGHIFNLIDTPGHVDFSYEVSRSLLACEGAILVVDATQGIEAQTLSNTYMALEHNLEIIPVLNKIDLPAAEPERRAKELSELLGVDPESIMSISAKMGTNVEKLLDAIIEHIPAPKLPQGLHVPDETKALIFDSNYDPYRGVVSYVRVRQGTIKRGDKLTFLSNKRSIEVSEVGFFKPQYTPSSFLTSGEVGYIVTGLKDVKDAPVGDTLWQSKSIDLKDAKPIPGFKKVTPFVYASIFSTDADDYPELRDSLEKLSLNDSSLTYEPERSPALGFGFRCGFLGMLHMEIVQERLEREYDLDLIITAPSVKHMLVMNDGRERELSTPSEMPTRETMLEIKEPWVKVEIMLPDDHIGDIMDLCTKRRGVYLTMRHVGDRRAIIEYEMPLASIIVDFYDLLKSLSSGYASLSYEFLNYRPEELVKMDILVAGDVVPPLSQILHKSEAQRAGSAICKKLKDIIPRANFPIALQAAIGGQIISRETISAFRKDVTAGLYGGDVSRKKKLLQKQKKGKKRAKAMGRVTLPQEAFLAILKKE